MRHTRSQPRRMAYFGIRVAGVAAQLSTLQLLNNSPYAEYLLIRDWSFSPGAADSAFALVQQGALVNTPGPAIPYLPTEAPPPGQIFTGTTVTQVAGGYQVIAAANTVYTWLHDWPFALVPPGWYFTLQGNTANTAAFINVVWEAVKPEYLDQDRWIDANEAIIINPQGTGN